MAQIYNAPKVGVAGNQSSIGPQFNTHYWDRKSLMDAAEEMFFSPLADVKSMPKHYGKELKVFYYVPLLDDLNVSDQGLDAAGADTSDAGLYMGSRDVGTISGKMPTLTEDGGRVNRVGFTRLERTGQIAEYGFFTEFTEDSLMFDTDSELYGHLSREMLRGANEINEDLLQIDLLNAADVKVFGGTATDVDEVSGASGAETLLTKTDLQKMSIILDDNRTPKKTTIIKGSRMTDTKVISASRIAYIGSELQIMFTEMSGYVPVEQYADAATIMNGEIGAIPGAHLRIVVVPQMMHWAGAGAAEGTNAGYQVTGGNYDVAPILVVGDESFATIGLQGMGGKGKQKFRIIVKKPGVERADYRDPYGKLGFSSISFWYGFIKLRGERIAVAYSPIPE
ncbi:major head protein [Roseobacter phage RD-1410W1-01]|uniref:Major capsid protein n=1 Tax=Roseobacter phage RD-1410W1-01 TaxID=1815984 RepID=A0A191VYL9_9CAUD|nr:major head protein [Roseobacter phage RD-1410W1-01]ANJ20804.1 major capsid protein [Roseobacter phage RD-1410W1-01]